MPSATQAQPRAVVTTSFDDGHPCDLRVAEILRAHGLTGTFYVAWNHPRGPEIGVEDLRALASAGLEIGSHTFSHRLLVGRPAAEILDDLRRSKDVLEQAIGAPVTSLSYPEGSFDARVRAAAKEAGFALARTTVAFRTARAFDPYRMPVSVLFARQGRRGHVRHALRDGNLTGLLAWHRLARLEVDPVRLARILFDAVLQHGGTFHLSARSWEIDRDGLWEEFVQVVSHIARWEGVRCITNREVLAEHAGKSASRAP